MSERIDWPGLMRLGLGVLRLPPDVFWGMTPRELAAAAAPYQGAPGEAPDRGALDRLMQRFPDIQGDKG